MIIVAMLLIHLIDKKKSNQELSHHKYLAKKTEESLKDSETNLMLSHEQRVYDKNCYHRENNELVQELILYKQCATQYDMSVRTVKFLTNELATKNKEANAYHEEATKFKITTAKDLFKQSIVDSGNTDALKVFEDLDMILNLKDFGTGKRK